MSEELERVITSMIEGRLDGDSCVETAEQVKADPDAIRILSEQDPQLFEHISMIIRGASYLQVRLNQYNKQLKITDMEL